MEQPFDRGISVAIAARDDDQIHLVSEAMEGSVVTSLEHVTPRKGPSAWANYPLGVLKVLMDMGISVRRGFNLLAESDLPVGAGMSSSAALELATAFGILALNGVELERKRIVTLCRKAENEFVGVPCGILDQGVSAFGGSDHLVHIDCLSETFTQLPLPARCQFWIFDSGTKHTLIDSKYAERHRECREAFAILNEAQPEATCLAHVSSSVVHDKRVKLGETRYRRALHVTEENARVEETVRALERGDLDNIGQLLNASHESSRTLFQNSCARARCACRTSCAPARSLWSAPYRRRVRRSGNGADGRRSRPFRIWGGHKGELCQEIRISRPKYSKPNRVMGPALCPAKMRQTPTGSAKRRTNRLTLSEKTALLSCRSHAYID